MKWRWNEKLFPSLNVINGKSAPYGSNGFLRHYHYRSDPKWGSVFLQSKELHAVVMTVKTLSLP